MPAYIIADVEITNLEAFRPYVDAAPALLARFGVEYLVRGGKMEVLEGEWSPTRLVILRFNDVEHAKRWYSSDEYQELAKIRQGSTRTNMVLVEAYEQPTDSG
jgi:uncharacterized protein (DUF1330 family)